MVQWDASSYGSLLLPHERWGAGVITTADPQPGDLVVDAGCGTGRDAEQILVRTDGRASLVLFDGDERMIESARARFADRQDERNPRIELVDLTRPWPVTSASVDAIVSVATFHWIFDFTALCSNAAQALRPGGRFVFECGGAGNLVGLARAAVPLGLRMPTCVYRTPEEAASVLEVAGFDVERARLQADPWTPQTRDECIRFLKSVIFHREPVWLLERLVDENPRLEIDYVRLQVSARRR